MTSALTRLNSSQTVIPSISAEGSRVFVSYNGNTVVGGNAYELFLNDNGVLTTLQARPQDPAFPLNNTAIAGPSFNFLYTADTNNAGVLRVRKWDSSFTNVVATQTFNDFQGTLRFNISFDEQYLALQYVTSTPPNTGNTVVRVLRTSDLFQLAFTNLPGIPSTDPYFFTVCPGSNKCNPVSNKQTYLAVTSLDFVADIATLKILQFLNNTLNVVDTVSLPLNPTAISVSDTCENEALIVIGITAVFAVENEPSNYTTAFVNGRVTDIPGDADGLRIYSYGAGGIRLLYSERSPGGTQPVALHPNLKCLLTGIRGNGLSPANSGMIGFMRCLQTCKRDKCSGRREKVDASIADVRATTIIPVLALTVRFSANGQWLFMGGGGLIPGSVPPAMNQRNINLYRVIDLEPVCC